MKIKNNNRKKYPLVLIFLFLWLSVVLCFVLLGIYREKKPEIVKPLLIVLGISFGLLIITGILGFARQTKQNKGIIGDWVRPKCEICGYLFPKRRPSSHSYDYKNCTYCNKKICNNCWHSIMCRDCFAKLPYDKQEVVDTFNLKFGRKSRRFQIIAMLLFFALAVGLFVFELPFWILLAYFGVISGIAIIYLGKPMRALSIALSESIERE